MAEFKIKLKIQSFELEIEGSRDDIPLITQAIGNQVAGFLEPTTNIVEGAVISEEPVQATTSPKIEKSSTPRKKSIQRKSKPPKNSDVGTNIISWRHDSEKYGIPAQDWVTADKSIWLLYVVSQETDQKELSSPQIEATFNAHFRQSKTVTQSNVTRDLGKQKTSPNATVGEDTRQSPSKWYLTNAGEQKAKDLVAKAVGKTAE